MLRLLPAAAPRPSQHRLWRSPPTLASRWDAAALPGLGLRPKPGTLESWWGHCPCSKPAASCRADASLCPRKFPNAALPWSRRASQGQRGPEDRCHRQVGIAWRDAFRKEEGKTQRSTRESGLHPRPLELPPAVPFPVPGPSLCAPPPTLSSVPSPRGPEWQNSSPRSPEGLALHGHILSAHILAPKSPLQTQGSAARGVVGGSSVREWVGAVGPRTPPHPRPHARPQDLA